MSESYYTVARSASAELTIEKSRFTAYVAQTGSREEAEAFIASVRESHKDATHNVPAFVIGSRQDIMWSSEDGEPQGTAGAPVLKMLVQEGLSDVCMVITRYFGGIKLGTGGLVRAYTDVAKAALAEAGRAEVREMLHIKAACGYKTFNRLESFDYEGRVSVEEPRYLQDVEFDFVVDPADEDEMTELLQDISGGQVRILKKIIARSQIIC